MTMFEEMVDEFKEYFKGNSGVTIGEYEMSVIIKDKYLLSAFVYQEDLTYDVTVDELTLTGYDHNRYWESCITKEEALKLFNQIRYNLAMDSANPFYVDWRKNNG